MYFTSYFCLFLKEYLAINDGMFAALRHISGSCRELPAFWQSLSALTRCSEFCGTHLHINYCSQKSLFFMQKLYGKIPRVRVPKIMWDGLTARRVLTMEWIDGVKLTDTKAMARHNLQIIDFVDVGIECSLRQLLAEDGGFFHADPHPGMLLSNLALAPLLVLKLAAERAQLGTQ